MPMLYYSLTTTASNLPRSRSAKSNRGTLWEALIWVVVKPYHSQSILPNSSLGAKKILRRIVTQDDHLLIANAC